MRKVMRFSRRFARSPHSCVANLVNKNIFNKVMHSQYMRHPVVNILRVYYGMGHDKYF